ncbi:chorismate synthase [Microbacterium sp. NRRL B-14842]|uniref:chorismate synthase n=1 Tax=Microbacterium sp. NRRL B-14842 TaxID=3162881 RepID=UPI003D2CF584
MDDAKKDGDTLGGIVEVLAYGLPPGLGSHVHWDRRLDARLAQALMSIQAIKGRGGRRRLRDHARRGSAAHDELFATADGIARGTDRAGGTEGGMSTGTVLRVRAGMKPIATVPHALRTIDIATGDQATAHQPVPTSAPCPRRASSRRPWSPSSWPAPCWEKFGGDSIRETRRNLEGYLDGIPAELRTAPASEAALIAHDERG